MRKACWEWTVLPPSLVLTAPHEACWSPVFGLSRHVAVVIVHWFVSGTQTLHLKVTAAFPSDWWVDLWRVDLFDGNSIGNFISILHNFSTPQRHRLWPIWVDTIYPKNYAHGFCFAVFCCGYTLTDIPISIRLTSLALWQSNDCPSASKVTLMNMDKYFMWIHYERLHNHNKATHNKTVCIILGIYCS